MSTLGAHRLYKRKANRVVILCSENLGPKLVFHTAFQEKYFVFPTDHNGQLTINCIFLRVISCNSQTPLHPQQLESRLAGACMSCQRLKPLHWGFFVHWRLKVTIAGIFKCPGFIWNGFIGDWYQWEQNIHHWWAQLYLSEQKLLSLRAEAETDCMLD